MLAFIRLLQFILRLKKPHLLIHLNKTYLAPEAYKEEIKIVESKKPGFSSRFANLLMV